MNSIVQAIQSAIESLFRLVLSPLQNISPIWGLTLISVVSGVILVVIYGKISNQKAIAKAKRDISGALLEAVLFRQDLRTSLKAQGKMLIAGGRYFFLAVPPILILMIPTLIILSQLNLFYNSRGLAQGEAGVLSIKLSDASLVNNLSLQSSAELDVTPPVRAMESGEIFWRVSPKTVTNPSLPLTVQGLPVDLSKQIFTTQYRGPIASFTSVKWWWMFLYPGDYLPSDLTGTVSEISLKYPEAHYRLLGFQLHWVIFFFIVSVLAGLVGSKLFGIEV